MQKALNLKKNINESFAGIPVILYYKIKHLLGPEKNFQVFFRPDFVMNKVHFNQNKVY